MSNERFQKLERPLTSEEMSQRVSEMMAERARHDAEFRARFGTTVNVQPKFFQPLERPLTSEEISQRVFEMMAERARQDEEFRRKFPSREGSRPS